MTTANLNLPEIAESQSSKYLTHNEALAILDALVCLSVKDRDLATPPGSPSNGDRYIVATGGTGAWSGHDGKIAARINGAWVFYPPKVGWLTYIEDEQKLSVYKVGGWSAGVAI